MSISPTAATPAPHVLFVDDYADALEVVSVLLGICGYRVATACTAPRRCRPSRIVYQPLERLVAASQRANETTA
jgi:hypothetical protein